MKRIKILAPLAACALLIAAAALSCASGPKPAAAATFRATEVLVPSRTVSIPAVLTVPEVKGKVPLVVMAHGHGGSKEEAGGFTAIAEELAKKGIASIRVDFPGCGKSAEPFTANNVTNMLADIDSARAFAMGSAPIDPARVAAFGYSMGGRVAILSTERGAYKSLALLAPVATDGSSSMYTFMGGEPAYKALADKAAAEGHVVFTTMFGQVQDLGKKWFADNEGAKCIRAIGNYAGPILYVHGSNDTIIAKAVVDESAAAAKKSAGVRQVTIAGADHGYGFYGGDPKLKADTVGAIVSFFAETLFK